MRREVRHTDVELLEAVRGGDTAAYGTLYQRHSSAACSLARQLAHDEDTVEDLVVETFAKVLELIRRGGGPASGFRPYLLASVRRYAATGVADLADGDSLYVDPELAGLERAPLARAYLSLPERWRTLLWHVEIEGDRPGDTGPLLGLPGKAAADLARRARQGLREAYVRLHLLESRPRDECRPILLTILRYLDNGLPKQEARDVDGHVAECIDCRSVFLEMADLTQGLRSVVGQLVAGPAVDGYLADLAATAVRGARTSGGGRAGRGAGGTGPGRAGARAIGRAAGTAGAGLRGVGGRARARLRGSRDRADAGPRRAGGRTVLAMTALAVAVAGAVTAGLWDRGRRWVRAAFGAVPARRWVGTAFGRMRTAPARSLARMPLREAGAVPGRAGRMLREAGAVPAAAWRWMRTVFREASTVPGRAGRTLREVGAGPGTARGSVGRALGGAGATLHAAYAGARAGLTRLLALLSGVPTPHRAVLAGVAAASLATAAFLLVAGPTGVLPMGISARQDRAGEGSEASGHREGGAVAQPGPQAHTATDGEPAPAGATGRPPVGVPTRRDSSPPSPAATGSGSGAGDGAAAPSAGIALGTPGTGDAPGGDGADGGEGLPESSRDPEGRPGGGSKGLPGGGSEGRPDSSAEGLAGGGSKGRPGGAFPVSPGGEAPSPGKPGRQDVGPPQRAPRQEDASRSLSGHGGGARTKPTREEKPEAPAVLAHGDRGGRGQARPDSSAPERQQVRGQLPSGHVQGVREQSRPRTPQQGREHSGWGRDNGRIDARNRPRGHSQVSQQGSELPGRGGGQIDGRRRGPERVPEAGRQGDREQDGLPVHAQVRPPLHVRGREGSRGQERRHALSPLAKTEGNARTGLTVAIDPLGALLRGQSGLVAVRLRNEGGVATEEIEATVTLPPGVTSTDRAGHGRALSGTPSAPGGHGPGSSSSGAGSATAERPSGGAKGGPSGGPSGGPNGGSHGRDEQRRAGGGDRHGRAGNGLGAGDGWSCGPAGHLVRCARGPLGPGDVTAIFLRVAVASDAPTDRAFTVRVRSGRLEAAAKSTAGVRSSGAAARFAADGRLATRVIGNALVSTAGPAAPCGAAAPARSPGSGASIPVDLDSDASTRTSSCAALGLPVGGQVLWAGLYWSGGGRGVVPAGEVRVRAPGASGYTTVKAAEVVRRALPTGSGYQAFADVTALVRTAGGGRWWVADAATRAGTVRHSAWSLVVMAADPRQPYTRAVVLDAAAVVRGGEEKALRIPLDGLAPDGAPARIDLVVWNGAGIRAGVVTVGDESRRGDGDPRRPLGRGDDGGGVAVDTLHALLGRRPALHLATRRDPVFFGVAVVSARTWS